MAASSAGPEFGENIILETGLEYTQKPAHVYLTSSRLIIEHRLESTSRDGNLEAGPSTDLRCLIIHLQEVVAVRADNPCSTRGKTSQLKHQQKPCLLQDDRTSQTSSFTLYVIKRISKHRWRHKSCQFVCHDYGTCQIWVDKINELLKNPEWRRPKRLLVFINPFGGKKRAVKIFQDKVQPLFEMAGIYSEVIVTKRQYHARDVIYEYDLETVDGLVSVGGDGTFSEVMNGLLDRTNSDAGIEQSFRHKPKSPSLRIGIIPAGSTDAVAYTLVGINDPVTSALQIIIGDCVGVDVTALYKKEEFLKYTITMSSYGYYGDLLQDSEHLRWMGPNRYTWSGLKTFLANRSYEGHISFLLASEEDSHPRDNSVCYAGCDKCRKAALKNEQARGDSRQLEFDLGSAGDVASVSSKRASFMMKDGWHHVRGKFSAITVVNISCRSHLSPQGLSPSSHLGDGCIDLILVQDCSRLQYLRHMIRIPNRKSDQFDFDFIQVYRVKEFSFQPVSEPEDMDVGEGEERGGCGRKRGGLVKLTTGSHRSSVWNCDGELVENPSLYIQVHCQLIKLFGRGVEDLNPDASLQCLSCCSSCDQEK
ncbi:unnamed protein product [Candidula unifasciata]|uniref:DAGKc domain-containing protein n=1 Tax=Candidula unifasciata TaxID=100452 RepID=A0A8S3YIH5_9EUPU|nr:unnamed protein product [Candidula unifasciata]